MKKGIFLLGFAALPAFGGLKFDETLKTVDVGVDSNTVKVDYSFKNEGDSRIAIQRYDAGCTCASAQIKDGKLDYGPGEEGVIRVTFDMTNFSGTVDKPMAIWLQGDPADKPSVRLTTRINIPVLVEIEPKTVTWDVGSSPEPKKITLTMNHSKPIHVKEVSGSNPNFTHELKAVEEGKKYELTITPAGTGEVGIAVFHIETDCAIPRHRTQRVFSVVRKPAATVATPAR